MGAYQKTTTALRQVYRDGKEVTVIPQGICDCNHDSQDGKDGIKEESMRRH